MKVPGAMLREKTLNFAALKGASNHEKHRRV